MKNYKLLSLTLLILVFFTVFLTFSKVQSQDIGTIEVYNSPIKDINPEHSFVGLVWAEGMSHYRPIYSGGANLNALGRAIKETNIDIIRYPGGKNVHALFWDVSKSELDTALFKCREHGFSFKPANNSHEKLNFFDFMAFCRRHGLKVQLQVNIHNYLDKKNKELLLLKRYETDATGQNIISTGKLDMKLVELAAKSAANQVKWVKDNGYSGIVKYWELGNEDYCFERFMSGYSGEEYAKVSAVFIKEMKAVDPSVKIVLTNIVDEITGKHNKWSETVLNSPDLKEYKDSVYAISNHIYGWGKTHGNRTYEAFEDKIVNSQANDMTKRLDLHGNIIQKSNMQGKKIFVNEFNQAFMTNPYIHSWLGALGNAEMVLSCLNSPYCEHLDYHQMMLSWCDKNDVYTNGGFGLYHFAKYFQTPVIKYSQAYAISLLNEAIKGQALRTDFVKQGIFASTVKDKDEIRVILVNKGQNRTINLKLNDFKNINYIGNRSLGIDVPEKHCAIETGDSCSNPEEVKIINVLENEVKVRGANNNYTVLAPKNTIIVINFRKG